MTKERRESERDIWSPLMRADLERVLAEKEYIPLHLHVLYWLIWLPLLSTDELLRLLIAEERMLERKRIATKSDLSEQMSKMAYLNLIDHIVLREPGWMRHHRYYSTDLGLYVYVSVMRPTPPLSVAQLTKAYPVERGDLLKRLAHPHLHLILSELATRLIAEGSMSGFPLLSYQQPWQHLYDLPLMRRRLQNDAALLIGHPTGSKYAFFVRVDIGPHFKRDLEEEKFLKALFDLRQMNSLYRQGWPALLLITTYERLRTWERLLLKARQKFQSPLLEGGMTTAESLSSGVYEPIWWDLAHLSGDHSLAGTPRIPLSDLFKEPISPEIDEQFSQQARFHEMLMQETALSPPRTKPSLTRYVGESLQFEAKHLTAVQIEALLLAGKNKDHQSWNGAGLLTLALTSMQKELLSWMARHPLLDIPTLLSIMRPQAGNKSMKGLQQAITPLFQLRLVETIVWPKKGSQQKLEGYILSKTALRALAIRYEEPYSYFFDKDQTDDAPLQRQLGVRGLALQQGHTTSLYHFMGELYKSISRHGEHILDWKSAHDSSREYHSLFQTDEKSRKIRPDAELLVASADRRRIVRFYLEYDRATTDEHAYQQKFGAYASYELAIHSALPLIVVVTPSVKAANLMQKVLSHILGLRGHLKVIIVLEPEFLHEGLSAIFRHLP